MKTKKIVLIISFLIMSFLVNSQNKTTKELLMAQTWEQSFPTHKEYASCLSYSLKECTASFLYLDKKKNVNSVRQEKYYYLTDKYETIFKDKMVGENKNGRYIMTKSIDDGKISCYEILKLNNNELVIQYIDIKSSKKGTSSRFISGRCGIRTNSRR